MYTASEAAKILNIHTQTLNTWAITNKITYSLTSGGHRRYSKKDLEPFVNEFKENPDPIKQNVIYARVSTSMQKDSLNRQIQRIQDYISANGKISNELITDIASGMNFNRPGFKKLLSMIESGNVDNLYIEYKDRLVRFGFDMIDQICILNKTNLVIINDIDSNHDYQKEVTDDMIAIIHHFSMKLYGARNGKKKADKIERN